MQDAIIRTRASNASTIHKNDMSFRRIQYTSNVAKLIRNERKEWTVFENFKRLSTI